MATACFSTVLSISLALDHTAWVKEVVQSNSLDAFITGNLGIFIIALIVGYPAHVLRNLQQVELESARLANEISRTETLISNLSGQVENLLSERENEILALVSKGLTNSQIANTLYISERTVKNHLYTVYKKLDISSREEAIMVYLSQSVLIDS
jgi:DNA-binding NarL/FixJ family response regulator